MNGGGTATFTEDVRNAIQFDSTMDAYALWMTVPKSKPLRDDGLPNKPLTTFTIEIQPLREGTMTDIKTQLDDVEAGLNELQTLSNKDRMKLAVQLHGKLHPLGNTTDDLDHAIRIRLANLAQRLLTEGFGLNQPEIDDKIQKARDESNS